MLASVIPSQNNETWSCGHVDEVKFHKFPTVIDQEKKDAWSAQVSKGRAEFNPGEYTHVCSNHFADGKPTTANPNPTLFLTISDNRKQSPVKQHYRDRSGPYPKSRRKILPIDSSNSEADEEEDEGYLGPVPMLFEHICQEFNIRFFTGFKNAEQFKAIFDHVKEKAAVMTYWDGIKKTVSNKKGLSPYEKLDNIIQYVDFDDNKFEIDYESVKPGPSRKLSLEQEYLLTLIKLRLGLMILDLAFHFQISQGKVSQIFITWINPRNTGGCFLPPAQ